MKRFALLVVPALLISGNLFGQLGQSSQGLYVGPPPQFSETCPLQPGQAAADYSQRLLLSGTGEFSDTLNFAELHATGFQSYGGWWEGMLNTALDRYGSAVTTVHFDGNDLDGSSVQGIVDVITNWAAHGDGVGTTGTLDVSGGTNATPGNIVDLVGAGWTVLYNAQSVTNAQKLALDGGTIPVSWKVAVTDGFKVAGAHAGSNGFYKTNGTSNGKDKYTPVGFAGEGDIAWNGSAWANTHGTFSTDDTTDFWDATDNGGGHTGYTATHPALQHYNGTDPSSETHWIND